jgi:cbb3-type cytochrome oxidase maturation protein
MNILFLTIPFAICLGLFFLGAFFFAVQKDQFEDLETPAYRALFDEKSEEK